MCKIHHLRESVQSQNVWARLFNTKFVLINSVLFIANLHCTHTQFVVLQHSCHGCMHACNRAVTFFNLLLLLEHNLRKLIWMCKVHKTHMKRNTWSEADQERNMNSCTGNIASKAAIFHFQFLLDEKFSHQKIVTNFLLQSILHGIVFHTVRLGWKPKYYIATWIHLSQMHLCCHLNAFGIYAAVYINIAKLLNFQIEWHVVML